MAKGFSRARRVGEQLKRELAQLIRSEMDSDARMKLVSITAVDVSRDLAYAKVYVTLIGDAEDRPEILKRLNQAVPMLRGALGRLLRIRAIPHLIFHYDESVEHGAKLSELIDTAVAADSARYPDD